MGKLGFVHFRPASRPKTHLNDQRRSNTNSMTPSPTFCWTTPFRVAAPQPETLRPYQEDQKCLAISKN